jgi:hypothetical protein
MLVMCDVMVAYKPFSGRKNLLQEAEAYVALP